MRRRPGPVSKQAQRHYTPSEITEMRIRLAYEMLTLIHADAGGQTLPQALQDGLQGATALLDEVLQMARRLP
jgi:hypothetical protein